MRFEHTVGGWVAPGYEPVLRAFASHFAAGRESDAQCCATVRGEVVVDLWGSARGSPNAGWYDGDSLQIICSSTKCLTSLAVASLVDRGLLCYDEPVSSSWPEFARRGKARVTVAEVLRHESGLANPAGHVDPEALLREGIRDNRVGRMLEGEALSFPEGTRREYHPFSRGLILNEVFRRKDPEGRTIGEWLAQKVRRDLNADVYVGADDEAIKRMARISVWDTRKTIWLSLLPWWSDGRMELNPREAIRRAKMVNGTASKDKNKKTRSDRGGGEWTWSSSYCKVAVRENGHDDSQSANGTRSSSTQTEEEDIEEEGSLDDKKADESEKVLPEVQDNGGDQGTGEEADETDSADGGEKVAEEKPDPENGEKDKDDEDVVVLVPSGKELVEEETESDSASQKADNENAGDEAKKEEETDEKTANEESKKEEENNDEGKLCEKEIEENVKDTSKERTNASDYEKANNDYGNRKENEEGGEKDDSSPTEIQDSGKSEEKLIRNNSSPPGVVVGAGNDAKEEEEEEERGVRLNPVPWFRPEVPMTLKASVEMTRDKRYLKGEVPSANGLCSARGMAKVAGALALGGRLGDTELLSERAWRLMHSDPTLAEDACLSGLGAEGLSPTEFTLGGVCRFRPLLEGESAAARAARARRDGFYGWMGYGGSVLQWHPGLGVGFAYAPTLWAWHDPANEKGAELQAEVARCAREVQKKAMEKERK